MRFCNGETPTSKYGSSGTFVLAILLVCLPGAAGAQLWPILKSHVPAVGSVVRARVNGKNYQGTLVGVRSDTLVIRAAGDSDIYRFPIRNVDRVDARVASRLRAAGLGGTIGMASGVALGLLGSSEDFEKMNDVFVRGSWGMAIGFVAGAFFTADTWKNTDIPRLPRVVVGCAETMRCMRVQMAWGGARR